MIESYDVIVIGGGPGGSTVSTLLADAGHRTLLLERASFPRYHIGESLLSGTADLLKKLQVLDKVEASGFVKKYGVTWRWGKEQNEWSVYFKDALTKPFDFGYQVERGPYDKLLLDNARDHGVEVRERHTVSKLLWEDDRLTGVEYESAANGVRRTAQAKWVVDASGQNGLVTQAAARREWDPYLRNMAIWGYWKGAYRPEGRDAGNTYLPTFSDGWWWFIPLRDEVTSIGAVIDRGHHPAVQSSGFRDYYLSAIERCPAIRERVRSADLIDEIRVQKDWSYSYDRFCGPGWFAVGDAACFIDPLFSTGVHLAMLAGMLAAVSINTILSEPSIPEQDVQSFYRAKYLAEFQRLRDQVYFLYGGHEAPVESFFWHARNTFDMPGIDPKTAFVSLIAGAFHQRSWYRAFLDRLEVPADFRDLAHQVFTGSTASVDGVPLGLDLPLRRADGWRPGQDLAVDGLRLRSVGVMVSETGHTLPLGPMMKDLLDRADGTTSGDALIQQLGGGDPRREQSARQAVIEAVCAKLLTGTTSDG